jgi:hypothetical protein
VGTSWENRHRYRAYPLDEGGRISGVFEIEADDDEGALVQAKAIKDVTKMELWDHERLVAQFNIASDAIRRTS